MFPHLFLLLKKGDLLADMVSCKKKKNPEHLMELVLIFGRLKGHPHHGCVMVNVLS